MTGPYRVGRYSRTWPELGRDVFYDPTPIGGMDSGVLVATAETPEGAEWIVRALNAYGKPAACWAPRSDE